MRHLVLFRFEEGYFTEEQMDHGREVFAKLQEALPQEILEVHLHRNCVERDTNANICVDMHLRSEQALELYLNHPIHCALVKEWLPHITNRISFDYKEQ